MAHEETKENEGADLWDGRPLVLPAHIHARDPAPGGEVVPGTLARRLNLPPRDLQVRWWRGRVLSAGEEEVRREELELLDGSLAVFADMADGGLFVGEGDVPPETGRPCRCRS